MLKEKLVIYQFTPPDLTAEEGDPGTEFKFDRKILEEIEAKRRG